jgi:uncharacterized protein (DUF1499 family)
MTKTLDPVARTLTQGRDHLARLAALFGVLTPAWFALSALGTKWGWWSWREGLMTLPIAGLAMIIVVALMALYGVLVVRPWGGRLLTGVGFAGPILTAGLLIGLVAGPGMRVPPIHDISTDQGAATAPTVALMVARGEDANPVVAPGDKTIERGAFAGQSVWAAQAKAYPAIQPLVLQGARAEDAFARAEAAVKAQGWTIVTSDAAAGRIEATAETFWYGFKDDIIIQVTPEEGGSRLDMRSISRVGQSDLGANAARLEALSAAIQAEAG